MLKLMMMMRLQQVLANRYCCSLPVARFSGLVLKPSKLLQQVLSNRYRYLPPVLVGLCQGD